MTEEYRCAGRHIVDTVLPGVGRSGPVGIDAQAAAEKAAIENVTGQQGDDCEQKEQGGVHGRSSFQMNGWWKSYDRLDSTVKEGGSRLSLMRSDADPTHQVPSEGMTGSKPAGCGVDPM